MPKWLDLNEVDDDEILLKRIEWAEVLFLTHRKYQKWQMRLRRISWYDGTGEEEYDNLFMIDVSGSMKGTKIGSLNSTMEELLPSLIGVGEASTDVKIAIMKFSTDVEWVTPEPVKIEEYQYWNRLEQTVLRLWEMHFGAF